jgi:gamma-glutamyl:cysteine ligase YbdK (ATP-grasp superfamily)
VRSSVAIEEDRWRAARHGVAGTLVDQQIGALGPARGVIGALLDRIEPVAAALGCMRGIHHARVTLERDTPATLRSIARADGLPGLLPVALSAHRAGGEAGWFAAARIG